MLRQGHHNEASLNERNAMIDLIIKCGKRPYNGRAINEFDKPYLLHEEILCNLYSKISVQMPSHITGEEDLLSPLPTTPCQGLFSL